MKFTDGYWQHLPGVTVLRPREVADVVVGEESLTVYASTVPLTSRGDTLNQALVTVSFHSPMDDVIGVRIEHHRGGVDRGPSFDLSRDARRRQGGRGRGRRGRRRDLPVRRADRAGLHARRLERRVRGRRQGADLVDRRARIGVVTDAAGDAYVHEQLALGVGEHVYGLGERFGAVRQERPVRRHLERGRRHRPASRRTRTCRST